MSKLYIINPNDRPTGKYAWVRPMSRFIFRVGGFSYHGADYYMIWAESLEAALDTLVDEGLSTEYLKSVAQSFKAARIETRDEILDECVERPDDEDLGNQVFDLMTGSGTYTLAGNASEPIFSDDWSIDSENPSREHVKWLIREHNLEVSCE